MTKKRKSVVSIITVAVCIAMGGVLGWTLKTLLTPPPVSEPEAIFAPFELPSAGEGLVTFLSGDGFVGRGGVWEEVEIGSRVRAGDSIKVVENGTVEIQFGGLAVLRIRQNSSLVLEAVDTARGGELSAKILAGTGLFRVNSGAGTVRVETPDGALRVLGTEFLVRSGTAGTFAAVREGSLAMEGGINVPEGYQVRFGTGGPVRPEALTPSGMNDLKELERLRTLELPDTGIPRMARVVVETSPGDALIFLDGVVYGRGRSSLVVPYGETLNISVAKSGYKTRNLELPVVSAEAEKRYVVRLEVDPSPEITAEQSGIEQMLLLESRIVVLEREIESRDVMYQALSGRSGDIGLAADRFRREAEASRRRISELESQVEALNAQLEQERSRVRQALELLQDKS